MIGVIFKWISSYRVGQLRYSVAKAYLETVAQVHRSAKAIFGIIFFIVLFTTGIVLASFGAVMMVPTSVEMRGMILLSLGLSILILSSVGYLLLNSEKTWIKFLKVESVLKEISGNKS